MDKIYLGMKSHVVCLDKLTGKEVWRTKLATNWGGVTNVQLDGDAILAYSNGILYCLAEASGKIRWSNQLKGLGHSYCMIASRDGSQQALVNSAAAAKTQQAATAGGGG